MRKGTQQPHLAVHPLNSPPNAGRIGPIEFERANHRQSPAVRGERRQGFEQDVQAFAGYQVAQENKAQWKVAGCAIPNGLWVDLSVQMVATGMSHHAR